MAKPTGFLEHPRTDAPKRPAAERVRDYREIELRLPDGELEIQAARCMDCGIPSCHAFGCPLANRVPDINEMVYRRQWQRALDILHSTNNFPEITGRICPALCEAACTLALCEEQAGPVRPVAQVRCVEAVAIREIEQEVVERGWQEGWIQPELPGWKSGKRVAVIGSGPAGLAAAQQLARRGHKVVVFERANKPGGILRYGIPDFKLEKWIIDRRLEQLRGEGVVFETGVEAGSDISVRYLQRSFQAIVIAAGPRAPRDLNLPGRELRGIHQALDFLAQQNRRNAGEAIPGEEEISAEGKHVVVIGGGDTGSDCVGTARRQGAAEIAQIELLPQPPDARAHDNPWPYWPLILRTSSSHEEGCRRLWSINTKEFLGEHGQVTAMRCVALDWSAPDAAGRQTFREKPDSDFALRADLALLAMGFVHVEHGPLLRDLNLTTDVRGNLRVDAAGLTSTPGVFACGDAVLGPSLVVRALAQGRAVATSVTHYLADKG